MKLQTNIAVGKLLSPFAVEGGIKVKSFSGFVHHFKKLAGTLVLLQKGDDQKIIKVTKVIFKGEGAVIFFEGYTAPETVKALSGYELWVDRKYAQPLETGEYYMSDLIGHSVLLKGVDIAKVVAYVEAANLMLEAKKSDGSTFFIPFIKEFVGKIDNETQTIELVNDECIFS